MRKNSFAPFIHTEKTAPYMYLNVLVSLAPCACFAIAHYGLRSLVLILVSMVLFYAFDFGFSRLINASNTTREYLDLSSLISGAIFALLLPPDTSIVVVLLGVLFGSLVVKQFFGGVGSNIVNPAIAARLFVQFIVPSALNGFAIPYGEFLKYDSLFSVSKTTGVYQDMSTISLTEVFFGDFSGFIGVGCCLIVILGFAYLLYKRIIRGYAFFGYVFAIISLYPLIRFTHFFSAVGIREYLVFIMSSGILFIGVFALGDFTTMPMNPFMRFIAGVIAAFVTLVLYGRVDLIVALCAPVIIVNFLTPSFDFFASTLTHKEVQKKRGDN